MLAGISISKLPTKKHIKENLYVGNLDNPYLFDEEVVDGRRYIYFSSYKESDAEKNKRDFIERERCKPDISLVAQEVYSIQGKYENSDRYVYYSDYEDRFISIDIRNAKFIESYMVIEKEKYLHTVYKFEELKEDDSFMIIEKINECLGTVIEKYEDVEKKLQEIDRTVNSIYSHIGCNITKNCGW